MDAEQLVALGARLHSGKRARLVTVQSGDPKIWDRLVKASMDEIAWLYSMHMPHQIRAVCARRGTAQIPDRHPAALREALEQYARAGYTILCNELELLSPPVARYLARCSELLEARCSANLYATPSHAQGFSEHADHQDLYVLQLAGEKTWAIREDAHTLTPVTLRPGNAMYVSRGIAHSGATGAQPSIHLTISLARVSLEDLVEAALAELGRQRPELQGLPAASLQVDDEAMAGHLRDLLASPEAMKTAVQIFRRRLACQAPACALLQLFER